MNTHRPLRTCLLLGIISLAHGVTYAFIQNAGTGISNYLKEVVTTSMQAPYLQGVYNKLPYSKVSIDKLEETTRRAAALTKEFVTYITALDRTEKALQSAYAAAGSQTSLADQTTFDDVEKFNMHNTIWDSKFGFQVNLTRYAYKSAPVVTASVSELGVDTGHAAALASTWKANFEYLTAPNTPLIQTNETLWYCQRCFQPAVSQPICGSSFWNDVHVSGAAVGRFI
ncbi:hypothetical protein AAMO2058_001016200 [Amorphochlora amoebiformis]